MLSDSSGFQFSFKSAVLNIKTELIHFIVNAYMPQGTAPQNREQCKVRLCSVCITLHPVPADFQELD